MNSTTLAKTFDAVCARERENRSRCAAGLFAQWLRVFVHYTLGWAKCKRLAVSCAGGARALFMVSYVIRVNNKFSPFLFNSVSPSLFLRRRVSTTLHERSQDNGDDFCLVELWGEIAACVRKWNPVSRQPLMEEGRKIGRNY
jgi:hypothetical protein